MKVLETFSEDLPSSSDVSPVCPAPWDSLVEEEGETASSQLSADVSPLMPLIFRDVPGICPAGLDLEARLLLLIAISDD